MAKKEEALYNEDREQWTKSSYDNLKLGKIFGIIGTILGALSLVFILVYVIVIIAAVGAAGMDSAGYY